MSYKKNGMTTALVIGLFTVITVLFYSLVNTLKQESHLAGRYSRISVLANLADAGCAIGLNELDIQLKDQNSKLFQALYNLDTNGKTVPKFSAQTGETIKFTQSNFPELKKIADEYPGTKVEIVIDIRYLREFAKEGNIRINEREKWGVAEVISKASNSNYGASQTIREKRDIKLTCNALPVVSRFSFFLRSANPAPLNANVKVIVDGVKRQPSSAFNLTEVKENGSGASNGLPAVIKNKVNGETGWVFLGGGSQPENPILINISGGANDIGEEHHFFRIENSVPKSCQKNTSAGIGGNGKNPVGNFKPLEDELAWYEYGFSDDVINNDAILGLAPLVDHYCPGASGKAASSVFHFFDAGNTSGNQYCIMLGNVYRAIIDLGVYRIHKGTNGKFMFYSFFKYLVPPPAMKPVCNCHYCQTCLKLPYCTVKATKISCNCDYCQKILSPPAPPKHYELTPEQIAQYIFDLKNTSSASANDSYSAAMSNIHVQPYMRSAYPEPLTGPMPENIKKLLEPTKDNEYCSVIPQKDNDFLNRVVKYADYPGDKSLNEFGFTSKYFDGDLGRQSLRVRKDEQKEFWDDTIDSNGKLKLNRTVVFTDDVVIPPINDIERGGIIVGLKKVTIKKIDFADRKNYSQRDKLAAGLLTVVSLGGQIIIDGNPVCAQLVSLTKKDEKTIDGEIVLNVKSLDIFGGMATNKIDIKSFTGLQRKPNSELSGIEYNPVLYPNPDQAAKSSYLTNAFAYSINLMPTIREWVVTSE